MTVSRHHEGGLFAPLQKPLAFGARPDEARTRRYISKRSLAVRLCLACGALLAEWLVVAITNLPTPERRMLARDMENIGARYCRHAVESSSCEGVVVSVLALIIQRDVGTRIPATVDVSPGTTQT